MAERYYVATDREGVQHRAGDVVRWNLPSRNGATWQKASPTTAGQAPLALSTARALLFDLDEAIFVAETDSEATKSAEEDGVLTTQQATLVAGTPWDLVCSAHFALDCAEHAANALGTVALPDGTTVEDVINSARQALVEMADDAEHHLGRLARLGAARRLRRQGEAVSDIARELLADDVGRDADAIDDPAYAGTAAVADAVLSAVEALRHLALPRYVGSREETLDAHSDSAPLAVPTLISTPWGPISIGAEHHGGYVPSWIAARDAATRARDAAIDREGESGGEAELAWQAERLEEILRSS